MDIYSCDELINFFIEVFLKKDNIDRQEEKSIFVTLENSPRFRYRNSIDVVFSKDQFKDIYNYFKYLNISNEIELCSDNSIEIPIHFADKFYPLHRQKEIIVTKDDINGIEYKIGMASKEYGILILNYLKDFYKDHRRRMFDFRNSWINTLIRIKETDEDVLHTEDLLLGLLDVVTLKITTKGAVDIQHLQDLSQSFTFQFMLQQDMPCLYYSDALELCGIVDRGTRKYGLDGMSDPPLRIYQKHILDYYRLALSSIDPFIQYISFYHVLEYFFDEIYNKNLIQDLQSKITSPKFSYKSEDSLKDIISLVKNRTKLSTELGQGNELESLKYVLKEYVTIDGLKQGLTPDQIKYYKDEKVSFSNAPVLAFNNKEEGFYTVLAKRIYFTRNALVHSKENKNAGRYKPYSDDKKLKNEIPLLKLIAEQVIIRSSKLI